MVEHLPAPAPEELDALTALWEASVRATHGFLAPGDISFFREMVRREALPGVNLYVIRETGGGAGKYGGFAAFAGTAGDMLEMLFAAPEARGKGLGRRLVEHAVQHSGVRRVDVNEQNTAARGFYERLGFRVAGRDATDPSGKPYPILHMELGYALHKGIVPLPSPPDRGEVDLRADAAVTDTEKEKDV